MSRAPKICAHPHCPSLAEPGRSRCAQHKPAARPGRPMPTNWKAIRARILARDRHRCHWCGAKATTVDHLTAVSRGGTDHDSNLVACCYPCNQSRGNRPGPPARLAGTQGGDPLGRRDAQREGLPRAVRTMARRSISRGHDGR